MYLSLSQVLGSQLASHRGPDIADPMHADISAATLAMAKVRPPRAAPPQAWAMNHTSLQGKRAEKDAQIDPDARPAWNMGIVLSLDTYALAHAHCSPLPASS